MASKAIIIKDLKKLNQIKKNEYKIRKIKHLIKHPIIEIKNKKLRQLQKIKKEVSLSEIKYRCRVTGRSHGLIRDFQLSRLQLKSFSSNGLIPGLRKSSW